VSARELITEHLDLWTGAVTKKSSSGRGSNGKVELTGVKKLRELILELAVRGSLVDQIPGGESAQELLERCLKAKAASVEQGKLKKARKHAPITSEDTPFSLPHGWSWSRLDDLLRVINGRAYKKHEMLSSGTPLLRVGNLFTSNVWYYSDLELEEDKYIDSGDLIYAWSASFGPFIWDGGRAIYHYHIWKLDLFDESAISKQFLFLYLKAITEEIKSSGSGIAMIHMTKGKMEELVFPIPPLEEQHRIVQKVDELMALCDRLEQQTSDQLEAHETLVDTLLGTLTQSENATELADNWARVAAHFDTLFTTEQSIDKLKQTIMQLAVMGRLVEQDTADEPASQLLQSIQCEISNLAQNGQIKKSKQVLEADGAEKPFSIPQSWQWAALENLALHSSAGWSPKCSDTPRNNERWGVLKVSAVTWGTFQPDENKELPPHLEPRPEYEVQPSDFLISRANTAELVARSVVVPDSTPQKLMMSDKIIRFSFTKKINTRYINLFNNCSYARSYYLSVAGGTSSSMKNVSRAQIQALAIPMPPINEQHRIVQKVDELMALCDQLKDRLNQASETRCQLAEAVVTNALN